MDGGRPGAHSRSGTPESCHSVICSARGAATPTGCSLRHSRKVVRAGCPVESAPSACSSCGNRLAEPHGHRSWRPSFSINSLSPCTTRTPRRTRVSDGNPFRRLLVRSKGRLVGVILPLRHCLNPPLQVPGIRPGAARGRACPPEIAHSDNSPKAGTRTNPPSLRALAAGARHRAPHQPRQRDGKERRGGVWAVVHVCVQPARAAPAAAHQPDGVHVQQERRRARLLIRVEIEDVRLPEPQVEALRPRRVLPQQEPEVSRWRVRGGDRQRDSSCN